VSRTGRNTRRPRGPGDRSAGTPLKAQPLDEQAGAGSFQGGPAVLDDAPGHLVLAPAGRDVTQVPGRAGAGRDDFGQGGPQQPHAGVRAAAIRTAVVNVENVQEERGAVSGPAPPADPGQQAVAAKSDPHPSRPATAGGEVAGQFLIEDAGQPAKEAEFSAPGNRAHGQVVLLHGQGTLQRRRLSVPGSDAVRAPGGHKRSGHRDHGLIPPLSVVTLGPADAAPGRQTYPITVPPRKPFRGTGPSTPEVPGIAPRPTARLNAQISQLRAGF
jgi:hypothetical protein